MIDDSTKLKVDVEVLKTQVVTMTSLCTKMDTVIAKLVDQQEKYTAQIYKDMENRRIEKNAEIKEIHDRIDTVIDKVQITELRIMEEIKELRAELLKKSEKESNKVETLTQTKWMVVGGIIAVAFIISRITESLGHLLTK
jgi:vacuolar-type H+-ATPase subunit I/STV1